MSSKKVSSHRDKKRLEGFRLKSTFKEIIFCRDSIETFEPSSSLFLKIQVIVEFFGIFKEKKKFKMNPGRPTNVFFC